MKNLLLLLLFFVFLGCIDHSIKQKDAKQEEKLTNL